MSPAICLTMMQGLPGSGKTHKANQMQRDLGEMHCKIFAPDSHFTRNGVYSFKASRLNEYHARTNMQVALAMASAVQNYPHLTKDMTLIVDACNILDTPLAVHFWLFKEFERNHPTIPFRFSILEPGTDWQYDPEECLKRTLHVYTIEDMQRLNGTFTYNRDKDMYARYRKTYQNGPSPTK